MYYRDVDIIGRARYMGERIRKQKDISKVYIKSAIKDPRDIAKL